VQLVAGRITRPHGIRGEVAVEIRTDEPDRRFVVGAELATDPAAAGPLVVEQVRWHQGRLLIRFAGRTDRTSVESLAGTLLLVDALERGDPAGSGDEDSYYDHELIGLAAVDATLGPVGTVANVWHHTAQDLLEVRRPDGSSVLVPFVAAIVPEVDLAAGALRLDAPPGLLDEVDARVDDSTDGASATEDGDGPTSSPRPGPDPDRAG
jgi:16S rRNA processing protein RimM